MAVTLHLFACRETEAALDLWTDMRANAATPSTFLDPHTFQMLNQLSPPSDTAVHDSFPGPGRPGLDGDAEQPVAAESPVIVLGR